MPKVFRLAKAASVHSNHRRYKMGCVIISNGKPVSVGFNSYKNHTITRKFHGSQTIHAELAALLPLKFKKIKHGIAVVFRQDKEGNPRMARPCSVCQKILASYGIKDYIYTTNGGFSKEHNEI